MSKPNVYIDLINVNDELCIQIYFAYGIYSFDTIRDIIQSNGGLWNKRFKTWIVPQELSIFCVDILNKTNKYNLILNEYFRYYFKKELKFLSKRIIESRISQSILNIPVPNGLEYLDFQKATVDFFNNRGRSILLADEMGSGKSISTLAIYNYNKYNNMLIICPDSIKNIWAQEVDKWLVNKRNISIISSTSKYPESPEVVIINYDIIHKFIDEILKSKFQFMVADEAHKIKTTSTRRFKALKEISKHILDKIVLTGTPILNRPIELYSIINLLLGRPFGNKFAYAKRYCDGEFKEIRNVKYDPKDKTKKQKKTRLILDDRGNSNEDELSFKLRYTVMLRRERSDILSQIPNIKRYIYNVAINKDPTIPDYENEINRYKQEVKKVKQRKMNNEFADYSNYIQEINSLKKFHFNQVSIIRREVGLKKVEHGIKLINDLLKTNKKIVVFSHHREVIEEINKIYGSLCVVLYGGMNVNEKTDSVNKFESDKNVKIFNGSILASGVGFTLTSSNVVVFIELDWTPSMIGQCESRCCRIGQKNVVEVYYIIANDSIDQIMLQKIRDKGLVIKTILS